jgi:hypothetical protein
VAHPSNAGTPLSPLGSKLRGVLYAASYLIPLVLAMTWGSAFYVRGCGAPIVVMNILMLIGIMYLPLVLMCWLAFILFFRLRAYLSELVLIMAMVSLPPGLFLSNMVDEGLPDGLTSQLLLFGLLLCASTCLLGTGGLWGLSVAQRYGEERTGIRLAYIALGWVMLPGFVAIGAVGFSIWSLLGGATLEPDVRQAWIILGVSTLLVMIATYGLTVERRCRKIHGPMRV